ncbi:MAG: ribbon-helix-helix domain-containing protein [Gammaproteobacteria bacterium]|uniref:CopG family ribbon-helix-helix protein n=1 Tax=Methylotuvimicrobium sp. TaxID=2822413 RepID=UPI001DAC7DFA|nr:ribbon-helix-helix domain-containing protein [Gammaproteobacteria bacterium]
MATTEAFTVRTEPDIVHQLGHIAESLDRSRNYIVNQALKEYLWRHANKSERFNQGKVAADYIELPDDDEIIRKIEDLIERKKRGKV